MYLPPRHQEENVFKGNPGNHYVKLNPTLPYALLALTPFCCRPCCALEIPKRGVEPLGRVSPWLDMDRGGRQPAAAGFVLPLDIQLLYRIRNASTLNKTSSIYTQNQPETRRLAAVPSSSAIYHPTRLHNRTAEPNPGEMARTCKM